MIHGDNDHIRVRRGRSILDACTISVSISTVCDYVSERDGAAVTYNVCMCGMEEKECPDVISSVFHFPICCFREKNIFKRSPCINPTPNIVAMLE